MKNIHDVLRQKENALERLKNEMQALRIVAPLLEENLTPEVQAVTPPVPTDLTMQAKIARAINTVWP